MTPAPLWLSETSSTNDAAWAEGPSRGVDFLAVAADVQTAGRGRHSRTWLSPAGKDLLFSVYLHPARPLAPAGIVTGLGAVAACEALSSVDPSPLTPHPSLSILKIRWPNDLYVGDRKLCGILAESREIEGRAAYVVGIGLNVNSLPEDWPPEIRDAATSIRQETGHEADRRTLLAAILERLEPLYRDAAAGRVAPLESAWRNRSDLAGRRVRLEIPGSHVEGTVLSAGLIQGLVLETKEGRRTFQAEHVTRVTPF